jgi:NAD-dependent deacetylase
MHPTTAAFTPPESLVDALRNARHIAVLTGAGISAESGLATFRDRLTGLWERYDLEDLVTTEALRRHPDVVWDWFADMRAAMEKAAPNPAHYALVEIEQHVPEFTLITQNIDGLHQRAGSSTVHELHGNIFRTRSQGDGQVVESWLDTGESPPRCPRTGAILRPDVVLFGEMLPPLPWDAASHAAPSCDVFLSIGTSGVVEPAASLVRYAQMAGATVVVTNLDVQTDLSGRGGLYMIHGRAGQVLPALVQAAWGAGE